MATKLFFIYAPEDGEHLTEIENQLKVLVDNGTVEYWHKGKLLAGSPWLSETETQLNNAQIVLPIVSSNFLASDECNKWLQMADKLGKQIVPIIAGSCLWEYNPILQSRTALPHKDRDFTATPISRWSLAADAYTTVVTGIAAFIEMLIGNNKPKQNSNNSSLKNTNDMPTPNLTFENGYALLIGIRYGHWTKHVLNGTLRDVDSVHKHFLDPQTAAYPPNNIMVLKEEQATYDGIIAALDELATKVANDPEASVIISYAGHGLPTGLAPYDYYDKGELTAKLFSDKIAAIKAKKLLVVLDSCHSEFLATTDRASARGLDELLTTLNDTLEANQASTRGIADEVSRGSGRVILTACKADQTALDIGTNGLFTSVLLECLNGTENLKKDGWVRLIDLINYVPKTVKERALQIKQGHKQEPMFTRIENLASEEFIVCAYDIAVARGFTKQVEQPSLNNPTINNVENAAINSPITAGGNVHIGNIITNNPPNPITEQTTPPNPNGMQEKINITELENAFNNADWAEVIKLLDNYFGNDTTPAYSILKATIENALSQGLQPSLANQQALKVLINKIKRQG